MRSCFSESCKYLSDRLLRYQCDELHGHELLSLIFRKYCSCEEAFQVKSVYINQIFTLLPEFQVSYMLYLGSRIKSVGRCFV